MLGGYFDKLSTGFLCLGTPLDPLKEGILYLFLAELTSIGSSFLRVNDSTFRRGKLWVAISYQ